MLVVARSFVNSVNWVVYVFVRVVALAPDSPFASNAAAAITLEPFPP